MQLEAVQKLVDIILKGVVATALAGGAFLVTRDKSLLDQRKVCDDLFVAILNYATSTEASDYAQKALKHRLGSYVGACGTLSDDLVASLLTAWKAPPRLVAAQTPIVTGPTATFQGRPGDSRPPLPGLPGHVSNLPSVIAMARPDGPQSPRTDAATPPPAPAGVSASPAPLAGWVSLGRIAPERYADVNFDRADKAGAPLEEGGAALRARWQVNLRAEPSAVGQSAVLGVIAPGDCVRVQASRVVGASRWARVAEADCPDEADQAAAVTPPR